MTYHSELMETLNIDVMILGGVKFYCTLKFTYNPLFKVSPQDLMDFVLSKRPTLRYEEIQLFIY